MGEKLVGEDNLNASIYKPWWHSAFTLEHRQEVGGEGLEERADRVQKAPHTFAHLINLTPYNNSVGYVVVIL